MINEPEGRGPDRDLPLPTSEPPLDPLKAFKEGLNSKTAAKTPAEPVRTAEGDHQLPFAEPWLRTRPDALVPAAPKVLVFLTDAEQEWTLGRALTQFADCEVHMTRVRCDHDSAPEEGTLAAKYISPQSGGVHLALHRGDRWVESLVMHDEDAVLFLAGNRNTLADWCASAEQPAPGDGQVRAVVFQPQYDWDTHTSPRPYRVIDDKEDPGRVDHQHYHRGRVFRLHGVVDGIEDLDVELLGDEVLKCPARALGRHLVFEDTEGNTTVELAPVESARVVAVNRAGLRLEVPS